MSKILEKLQARIDSKLNEFNQMRNTDQPNAVSSSPLGKANDKMAQFISKAQQKKS